jgi:hypothetical protein
VGGGRRPQSGVASVPQAAQLLASVVGQDLEQTGGGVFRIARRVAKDRIISTVDPEARHGHKTSARGFDGYKGHVAVDPDSEIVTDTVVSAGNVGDAAVAQDLIDDLLDEHCTGDATGGVDTELVSEPAGALAGTRTDADEQLSRPAGAEQPAVYGDAAYGSGAFLDLLAGANIASGCKTPAPDGRRWAVRQGPVRHRP